jgi:hypothetical protein
MSETGMTAPPDVAANARVGAILQRLVLLVFAGLGVFVGVRALQLSYYTPVGPGPGFFPFWLGALLAALSLLSLALTFRAGRQTRFEERIIPERHAALSMLVNFGMIAFFALTIRPLGFVFSMFGVLIVLLLVNRVSPLTALAVAIGGSLGVGYAFVNGLSVYVPVAPNGLLSVLGL